MYSILLVYQIYNVREVGVIYRYWYVSKNIESGKLQFDIYLLVFYVTYHIQNNGTFLFSSDARPKHQLHRNRLRVIRSGATKH